MATLRSAHASSARVATGRQLRRVTNGKKVVALGTIGQESAESGNRGEVVAAQVIFTIDEQEEFVETMVLQEVGPLKPALKLQPAPIEMLPE